MVRRLIEQQNVRPLHQRCRNRQPLAPPAGECSGFNVQVGEACPAQNLRDRDSRSSSATFARSSAFSITVRIVSPPANSEICITALSRMPLRMATSPLSGVTCPCKIASSVDFPEPFGPITPMRLPRPR